MNLIEFTKDETKNNEEMIGKISHLLFEDTKGGQTRFERINKNTSIFKKIELSKDNISQKEKNNLAKILLAWIDTQNVSTEVSTDAYVDIINFSKYIDDLVFYLTKKDPFEKINIRSIKKTLEKVCTKNYKYLLASSDASSLTDSSKFLSRISKLDKIGKKVLFDWQNPDIEKEIPLIYLLNEVFQQKAFFTVFIRRLELIGTDNTLLFSLLYDIPAKK